MTDTVSEDVKLDEAGIEAALAARSKLFPYSVRTILNSHGVSYPSQADAVMSAAIRAYLAATKPPLAGEVEVTGEMWLAGRKAFDIEAEKFRAADRYEMASAIADRAPEIIFKAMLAASRTKEDTQQ